MVFPVNCKSWALFLLRFFSCTENRLNNPLSIRRQGPKSNFSRWMRRLEAMGATGASQPHHPELRSGWPSTKTWMSQPRHSRLRPRQQLTRGSEKNWPISNEPCELTNIVAMSFPWASSSSMSSTGTTTKMTHSKKIYKQRFVSSLLHLYLDISSIHFISLSFCESHHY